MSFVGRVVATGAWAGWRVTAARAILFDVGLRPDGKPGSVEYTGLLKCRCKLEDPSNLKCTAAGVVLFERDLVPQRTRAMLSV